MEPTKIGEAYDQITHLWESDKFNRENGIAEHKRAISFVQYKGKALDVGCGCTGRFIDLLLDQGFTPCRLRAVWRLRLLTDLLELLAASGLQQLHSPLTAA